MNARRQLAAILISCLAFVGVVIGLGPAAAATSADPTVGVSADPPPSLPPGGEHPDDTKWD
jgi:hypothetical protein